MIAVLCAGAMSVWAWRAHEEVQRLDASLDAATQRIDQLQTSLSKARQGLDDTRAELNRALDAAEQASQANQLQQPAATVPVALPPPPEQPTPSSPMEMAQLQASQSQDSLLTPADTMLELKGRH